MEVALGLNIHHSTLNEINQCRIFLQVITVSDIVTANGKSILLEVLEGTDIQYRASSLSWPR
jgi:hypothetical protein